MYTVFGASGHTGRIVAERLVAAGKQVRAVVRDAAKAPAGTHAFVGDVTDRAFVVRALAGAYLSSDAAEEAAPAGGAAMTEDLEDLVARVELLPPSEWETALRHSLPADKVGDVLDWICARQAFSGNSKPRLEPEASARYELLAKLAEGTTGSVWHARDKRFNVDVAVKIFSEGRDVTRVHSEARAMRGVASPYVVSLYDVHIGTPSFIVMDLVAERLTTGGQLVFGRSAQTCKPRSISEAVSWTIDVARGIQLAHAGDVFHRDLKPSNVFVRPRSRRVQVGDFGIAANAASVHGDRIFTLVRSRDGKSLQTEGTPAYMAPEQARGIAPDIDPRNVEDRARLVALDVWGLGALLFAFLTGRPPWQADTPLDAWELALEGRLRPPTWKFAGKAVPRRLRRIVDKAMARDPSQRFSSAEELAEALTRYRDNRPTSLDRSVALRAALWFKRSPFLASAALIIAVLAFAVGLEQRTLSRLELDIEEAHARRTAVGVDLEVEQMKRQRVQEDVGKLSRKLDDLREQRDREKQNLDTIVDVLAQQAALEADVARKRAIEDSQRRLETFAAQYGRMVFESAYTNAAQERQGWHDKYVAEAALRETVEGRLAVAERKIAEAITAKQQLEQLLQKAEDDRRTTADALTAEQAAHVQTRAQLKAAADELATIRPAVATDAGVAPPGD